jgi:hypothetical protein
VAPRHPCKSPARAADGQDTHHDHPDEATDQALEESFPASDPPSVGPKHTVP